VIGMGVAPWLHSLNTAIREFARVLRPGGYLILTADNRWRLNHVLDPLFFPPLRVPRRSVRTLLERLKLLKELTVPRPNRHSIKEFDACLAAAERTGLPCVSRAHRRPNYIQNRAAPNMRIVETPLLLVTLTKVVCTFRSFR